MIRELFAVGLGGAAGSIVRYMLSVWLLGGHTLLGFPAGTFTVNAAGSLLIGILLTSAVVYAAFNTRLEGWGFVAFFGFIYLMYSIAYTMHDISYWGMVAALGSAVVVYYNTSDAVTVIDAIFESCSAFGTVGLSVGVTSQLNTGAKLLYMLVMFMGRVGPVSFAISLTSKPDDNKRKILPVGQINVG